MTPLSIHTIAEKSSQNRVALLVTVVSGLLSTSGFAEDYKFGNDSMQQEGSDALDHLHVSWPLANRQMAASLKFANYDNKFVMGSEGDNGRHGGAILQESQRWLWRGVPVE